MSAAGSSINTGFSAILTNLPLTYHFFVINEGPTRLAFSIATSAPTSTTTNQMWVSNSGTVAIDSIAGEYMSTPGMNLYARCDADGGAGGISNSGSLEVFFKGG